MSVETPGAVGGFRLRCLLGRDCMILHPADPNLVHAFLKELIKTSFVFSCKYSYLPNKPSS